MVRAGCEWAQAIARATEKEALLSFLGSGLGLVACLMLVFV
jgi:hypothetical protein